MTVYVDFDPDLAEIGVIEPVFVEEFDYTATKQIVLDREIEVTWIHEIGSAYPVEAALDYHYEDCDIPVYKSVLKWRSTIDYVGQRWDDPRNGLPLRNEWR